MTGLLLVALVARGDDGHWAYRVPVAGAAGEYSETENPVDKFLRRGRKEAGLEPVPAVSGQRWLARAAFTLTGLPPNADQRQRIEARNDAATRRELIDELLADPAYGERWARHWMDVARYADTQGYNFDRDNRYPYAYTYRNWLIRAFNEDLRYDRFIKLQIAADHLVDRPDHPDVAALGLLTVGPRSGHVETIDDRVDVVTRGFLSTTVSCARCHDHKTDPISQEDYYSIFSILENLEEVRPVIGRAADTEAFEAFREAQRELEERDRGVRQAIVDQLRSRDGLANYLELAWRADRDGWDEGQAGAEGFKRGRYRAKAILRWRDFLRRAAWGEEAGARLARWAEEMDSAETDDARMKVCDTLAARWLAALESGGPLAELAADAACPLSYGVDRIHEIYDQQDGNEQRERDSAMARLETEHAGAPPRAMAVRDKEARVRAQVFRRGSPGDRGEPFEPHWLSILGGGSFPEDVSQRRTLAEQIASRDNPLTARVMVNRVWAWHFGAPLADPGDFGPQQPEPLARPLLDELAVWFMDHGWSLKELHRLLVSSETFRLAADGPAANDRIDEANAYFWKWNRRRLDFEAMRDRLLATAGALETGRIGGRSVDLRSAASDSRRSVYGFVDRYAFPGLLVNFDVPHPDHHAPRRLETTVPQQALYFLNHTLPIRQASRLVKSAGFPSGSGDEAKVNWLFERIYQREPSRREREGVLQWIQGTEGVEYSLPLGGHWEVRHAPAGGEMRAFPIFADGVWKTGPDPETAPVRWLNAGATGGHAANRHELILRWRAHAPGEVRMSGTIARSQEGGDTLKWQVAGPDAKVVEAADFPPDSEAEIESPWMAVEAGDTMDFVLRAPQGDACGGVTWDLRVLGREETGGEGREIGELGKEFPRDHAIPPMPPSGNHWADFAQMLWASNEFHFID